MNDNLFLRYIENDRDCEQDRLDIAVNRGLHRAKNDRFDPQKLFLLAAAGVFTFAMCITVNLRPFTTAMEIYSRNRQKTMSGSSERLDGYIKDMAGIFEKYSGGE
jgi:hypothetical protein